MAACSTRSGSVPEPSTCRPCWRSQAAEIPPLLHRPGVVIFIETALVPFPGDSSGPVGSSLDSRLAIIWLIVLLSAAAIVGDSVAY